MQATEREIIVLLAGTYMILTEVLYCSIQCALGSNGQIHSPGKHAHGYLEGGAASVGYYLSSIPTLPKHTHLINLVCSMVRKDWRMATASSQTIPEYYVLHENQNELFLYLSIETNKQANIIYPKIQIRIQGPRLKTNTC